ncbi:5-formyltetrahydrofolate cyclo-ligase [Dyadobacter sp. CY312]|uniref:5-formyltetrahydrofolate cyclo-ligase n=1 Tax=Dyadobacter sp. CY312 TaxID=2907303 RepID=UPI001F1B9B24|nr:5-formyltetrahydrofolate cyclo-ligase [Dyadobacter sp. CY312]MCE7042070.1 5-formyltetrahydrofolate cyclo-ligase [Dyadobacter sp. CY312]
MALKASLRNLYLHKRDLLSKVEQEQFNAQIVENLSILLQGLSFSTVHTFLAQTGKKEIDTQRIIDMICEKFGNVRIVVPRITPGTRILEHYLLDNQTRLILNRWLIPEPDPASSELVAVKSIDIVFVPLLAFDNQGFRVGYGGGYYDRFLAECRNDVLKVGLSFFEPIPQIDDINPFDVPMDYCITPGEVFSWSH